MRRLGPGLCAASGEYPSGISGSFASLVTIEGVLMALPGGRFKLFLEPSALRDDGAVDPRLPKLPVNTITLFLKLLATDGLSRAFAHSSLGSERKM